MGVWEWIAATVQAMRFHLEMKLNRGGTVAAISLSTMHMRSAACPAVMLIIVQHLEFDIFEDSQHAAWLLGTSRTRVHGHAASSAQLVVPSARQLLIVVTVPAASRSSVDGPRVQISGPVGH